MTRLFALVLAVGVVAPCVAGADEAKAPISAAILLNVLNAPVESRGTRALRVTRGARASPGRPERPGGLGGPWLGPPSY